VIALSSLNPVLVQISIRVPGNSFNFPALLLLILLLYAPYHPLRSILLSLRWRLAEASRG